MRVIDLALKDLNQLVRDWKSAFFLVAMPIVFTTMFSFLFGGGDGEVRLPVGVMNRDGDSVLAGSLVELMQGSGVISPQLLEEKDADEIERMVRNEDLAAAVIIPAGYDEGLRLSGSGARVALVLDEASPAVLTAQGEIQAAVARVNGAAKAAQLSTETFEKQTAFADEAARRQYFDEALTRAITAWKDPPLTVVGTQSGAIAVVEEDAEEDGESEAAGNAAHSSAGIMVQFAIAGLIGAAEILVVERKTRSLQRLLTTAISRVEIILGHFLAMLVMILVQLVILVSFGQFVLGVDYLRQPLAVFLVMFALALWAASLGLLIGTLAKNEEQALMFSMIPMFVLAGLGGAWIPLEFTPATFQTIGHLTPTAWAIDGFENVIVRGLGLESVLLPCAVLLGFAVVCFGLGVWRFRFE